MRVVIRGTITPRYGLEGSDPLPDQLLLAAGFLPFVPSATMAARPFAHDAAGACSLDLLLEMQQQAVQVVDRRSGLDTVIGLVDSPETLVAELGELGLEVLQCVTEIVAHIHERYRGRRHATPTL